MAEKILEFTVNGKARRVHLDGWERLLDVLREHLDLTGSKRGCDDASCGACTVLMDGVPTKACVTPASKAEGTTILTIEAMAEGGELHPIQKALIEAGAVQCGYCIPGIVMELYGFFTLQPEAGDEELKKVLAKHLCRCTGYEAIWNGAVAARELMLARG